MAVGDGLGDGDAGGRLVPQDLDGVDPVSAVLMADAGRSAAAYPEPVALGPLFAAAERVPGGWQVLCPGDPFPQGARELLADRLEEEAAMGGDGLEGARSLAAAAWSLRDGRPRDELAVGRRVFRVVRVEQLVRTGPDGPEPPRPTDLDPHPYDRRRLPPRPFDLLPDGQSTPDLATAELLCQVLDAASRAGSEPSGPFLAPVQLAPAFTVAERTRGRWRPVGRVHDVPQDARDSLATYFRHVLPAVDPPDPADRDAYDGAADRMAGPERHNGIEVAGRRFRIVRIERVTLTGPDGPEPPRPTDAP